MFPFNDKYTVQCSTWQFKKVCNVKCCICDLLPSFSHRNKSCWSPLSTAAIRKNPLTWVYNQKPIQKEPSVNINLIQAYACFAWSTGESHWLQWDGSCVWREIGACMQERWRLKNKNKTRENIILCCFSLSNDTKTHSQGGAKVLLLSFVPACTWGAFRWPLYLAPETNLGCRAALREMGCLWQREGTWHRSWSLWALSHPLDRPTVELFSSLRRHRKCYRYRGKHRRHWDFSLIRMTAQVPPYSREQWSSRNLLMPADALLPTQNEAPKVWWGSSDSQIQL